MFLVLEFRIEVIIYCVVVEYYLNLVVFLLEKGNSMPCLEELLVHNVVKSVLPPDVPFCIMGPSIPGF